MSRQQRYATYVLLLVGCGAPQIDPAHRSPEVLIDARATNIQYASQGQVEEADYTLLIPHPATEFLAQLSRHLEHLGWIPSEALHEAPDLPTSQIAGWSSYVDKSGLPTRTVHQWSGEWTYRSKLVIAYTLLYVEPDLNTLTVLIHRRPLERRAEGNHEQLESGWEYSAAATDDSSRPRCLAGSSSANLEVLAVSRESECGARMAAFFEEATYCYDPGNVVLTGSDFCAERPRSATRRSSAGVEADDGKTALVLPLTDAGARKLRVWISEHPKQEVGVVFEGELVAVSELRGDHSELPLLVETGVAARVSSSLLRH